MDSYPKKSTAQVINIIRNHLLKLVYSCSKYLISQANCRDALLWIKHLILHFRSVKIRAKSQECLEGAEVCMELESVDLVDY